MEYSEALDVVLAHSHTLPAVRAAPLAALGAVLAEDVLAPHAHPPFAASIKDGYAVRSDDAAREYSVVGASRAGVERRTPLGRGEAVYITTGAPLPPGADAVVQIEEATAVDDAGRAVGAATSTSARIRLRTPPARGQDVRPVGFDVAEGSAVLRAGGRVGAAEVGLLATLGCREVAVARRPKLAVLSSGDELVDPLDAAAPPLRAAAIFDANRPMLLAAAAGEHADAVDLGVVADDAAALEAALEEALRRGVDVLVCTGGVSMGDRDLIKPLLAARGTVHFGKVRLKPGKPLTFATVPRHAPHAPPLLVFALPGNPVSAHVCFHLVVAPALRKLAAAPSPRPRRLLARLAAEVKLDKERPEFHRARLSSTARGLLAHSTGEQISSRLLSCVGADALVELPAAADRGAPTIPAGALVSVLLIGDLARGDGAWMDLLPAALPPHSPRQQWEGVRAGLVWSAGICGGAASDAVAAARRALSEAAAGGVYVGEEKRLEEEVALAEEALRGLCASCRLVVALGIPVDTVLRAGESGQMCRGVSSLSSLLRQACADRAPATLLGNWGVVQFGSGLVFCMPGIAMAVPAALHAVMPLLPHALP
ncbi:hypothetical protein AB1Y20_016078 [Prymnesium parvum]|uniref:MoaB/Mog domain-containing protein n=1 Tax=Prymnesium parvum TaxID=97485 RepID=A0AB34K388_PRYPA